jgi:hypothetical protein
MEQVSCHDASLESQFIPGGEDKALGAVFAELLDFVVFEDAEGFAGEAK